MNTLEEYVKENKATNYQVGNLDIDLSKYDISSFSKKDVDKILLKSKESVKKIITKFEQLTYLVDKVNGSNLHNDDKYENAKEAVLKILDEAFA